MDTEPPKAVNSSLHVVGDVHGHLDELVRALHAAGLVDTAGHWCAGTGELWFLGDFVDRGPDGVGVIEFVMALQEQAEQAGGRVTALLGNHEVLMLGMHRFGDTEVPDGLGLRSFERSWTINGGLRRDLDRLTDRHLDWLTGLDVLALTRNHLLMHSDTVEYLDWGRSIAEVNSAVRTVLTGDDLVEWWECWRRMTTRYSFRGDFGGQVAKEVLDIFGGQTLVHGHTVISDQLGVPPEQVTEPLRYAGGRVLAVDGGLFIGGPCLVVPLPYTEPVNPGSA
ncbi:metallophosphoesterase family protein [Goodfellowiella coeruleoviolacea]|uniref:metallophosphoesterase family protein n=1 Tax=Goodfellowiella coeruleoviolacea TaxID=334858 RepID=UPI000AD406AE|nr:metallophosphoesterase family protein [Goodfellowiella coeruleoviolacea]